MYLLTIKILKIKLKEAIMVKFFSTLVILSLALVVYQVCGKAPIPKEVGVTLNSQAPEVSVIDTQGKEQTIKQLTGEKGLILIFFRSADWCPFCKKHLIEINQWQDKLNKIGYKFAGVSYDSIEILKTFSDKQQLKYPLLADQNNQTMKDYKVLHQDYKPDSNKYGIPYPGVVIVDNSGKITYKYFYQGYKDRVNLQELYDNLKQ